MDVVDVLGSECGGVVIIVQVPGQNRPYECCCWVGPDRVVVSVDEDVPDSLKQALVDKLSLECAALREELLYSIDSLPAVPDTYIT